MCLEEVPILRNNLAIRRLTDLMKLISSQLLLGHKSPDRSNNGHYRRNDKQDPIHDSLPEADFRPKYLEMKRKGQDYTYCEAETRPDESHDSVKKWEDNRNESDHSDSDDAYYTFESGTKKVVYAMSMRGGWESSGIETTKNLDGSHNWPTAKIDC